MQNRRTIIKSALAAVACAAIPPSVDASAGSAGVNSWVLVAEEVSANGWKYPQEALATMAKSAKGVLITAITPIGSDAGEIGKALGMVTHATLHNGAVWVIPRWFGGQKPEGFAFIAPWGFGRNVDGHIEGYKLERMVASPSSSFANATKI